MAAAIRLARGDPVPASTTIGTELIVRRSCGCLPAVARALPQSAPLPGDRLERLFTAYAAEAAGRTRGEFQRLLSDLVRDSLRAGEGVEVWWQLLETLRGITDGLFDPTPGEHCRSCDFLSFCEAGRTYVSDPS